MKQFESDILIVGSGLTGIIAAYALSSLNQNIIIIDQKKILLNNKPDFKSLQHDTRTTAIAEGSKEFLSKIGLWQNLNKFSEPIKKIKVIDRTPNKKIDFFNNKKNSNLGYIIENSNFLSITLKKLIKKNNIKFIDQAELKDIKNFKNRINCEFNNCIISTKLLIAADGKNSSIRSIKKTKIYKKTYKENALVVNFDHTVNHNNCAYEFFYNNGPLALLPMKKKQNFKSSLIWSNNKNYLESLINADQHLLKEVLQEKISETLGNIIKINSKKLFPLSAHINYKFYDKQIVYIGDAAHSVHPIAGQGWNLGLRDVKKLYYLIEKHTSLGLEIESRQLCEEYHQACFYDAFRLFQITDKLNSLFMVENRILNGFFVKGHTKKLVLKYLSARSVYRSILSAVVPTIEQPILS